MPAIGELMRSRKSGLNLLSREELLAFASRQRGRDFNRRSPPS